MLFRAVIWHFGLVFLHTNINWWFAFIAFNLKDLKFIHLNQLLYFIVPLIFFNQELEPEKQRARIHHETRIHILNLLITSLECSPPSLALYLLGYELKKPVSTTNLQDPGMKTKSWSCIRFLYHQHWEYLSENAWGDPVPLNVKKKKTGLVLILKSVFRDKMNPGAVF